MIKRELRKKFKAVRDAVNNRDEKISRITDCLIKNELYRHCSDIFLYYPSGSEVSTSEIYEASLSSGKKVAFPKCIDTKGSMEFYYVTSIDDLSEGMYGIYEPAVCVERKAVPSENSLMVVPGLAFDKCGFRLGYGKGYYDRFLSLYNCKAIGIAFDECVCDELPHGMHDYKIDCLITDKEEYYF